MKQGEITVSVCHVAEGLWSIFVDYEEPGGAHESSFVKEWKTEGEAEMHAEIIRCAMAWGPSRAGRRWRSRSRPGRRAGDKAAK